MVKVYAPGTPVASKQGNIPMTITAVNIRESGASYECSYFAEKDYRQIWLYEYEFTTDSKKQKIGFKQ